MSTSQKSKRRAKERNMRQIAVLHFAFSQLHVSYEATRKAWQKAQEEYTQEELEPLRQDLVKLEYMFKEMMQKLRLYMHFASTSQSVALKVLAGLNVPPKTSNIQVFAVMMVRYQEDCKPPLVMFSKRFWEIVYEIDAIALDEVRTDGVLSASQIAHKIFDRIMNGDYLEFKVAA